MDQFLCTYGMNETHVVQPLGLFLSPRPVNTQIECQPHKMVKHTQTIRRQQATSYLSEYDHFVGLTGNELINIWVI